MVCKAALSRPFLPGRPSATGGMPGAEVALLLTVHGRWHQVQVAAPEKSNGKWLSAHSVD